MSLEKLSTIMMTMTIKLVVTVIMMEGAEGARPVEIKNTFKLNVSD